MSNNFEWNEHDFVEKHINIKDTKNKILSTESVKLFKIFFSANQILFYAHMSMVKLRKLFDENDNKMSSEDRIYLQKFQTEANYLFFSFMQTILPYRDAVKNTKLMSHEKINKELINKPEFDFFLSLRNYQTHEAIPILNWTIHHNFKSEKKYVDVLIKEELIDDICIFKNNSEWKNFKNGGYEFLLQNKNVPIYILANNFLKRLIEFHKYLYELLKEKIGKDLDECEYYLRKIEEYYAMCIHNTFQKVMKLPDEAFPVKKEYLRFDLLLREFGGEPTFFEW
ncbi:hypothetical protein [Desulfovibrio desulfuricans]|uniref:hypothetical protein n=1 Tax=Desulfovibrio desulfuricans TaxID=876 RepID=UPI001C01CAD9|nr:hypothetical protein [Desulfovibrio desulfuricans]MBT9747785.1 hypothetical protein [Desulfovibrio desulfuricans]